MGISGSGSLEQSLLLEAFGPERQPKVVVMAYFEGNDLQDSWKFNQTMQQYLRNEILKTPLLERYNYFRPLRFLSAYAAGLWAIDQFGFLEKAAYGDCPYPMTDAYGNEMTFYDLYVAMSTVETQALAQSEIWSTTTQAIRAAADQAAQMEAAFVLMFIPTSFHAHWKACKPPIC